MKSSAKRPARRVQRLLFALALAAVPPSVVATIALAQTGRPRTAARTPKAAPPVRDAQAPSGDDGGAPAEASAPPPGAALVETSDAGRLSPLNPAPDELASGADAGAPVDYDRLLADVAALRARVAAVSDNLYRSRIAIALQTDGDHAKLARLTVSLDDGVVFTAPASFAASDMTPVYDHAVAPGRHAVTVDVDRKDARDETFRTSQRSRFMVDVPRDNKVDVQVKIIDDSSMGADFPSDRSGRYDLRFRVKAVARPVGR